MLICSHFGLSVLRFWFLFYFCILRQSHFHGAQGMVDVPSGWIQVLRGPRPKSVQWPLAKDRLQPGPQEGVSERWRQPKSANGAQPGGSRQRINPDVAREMAHTKVSRLEKALEAMGDLQGPVVEASKADLAKARAASKKPSVEVEIDECRKFISRAERRIRELDTEREKEQVFVVEAQERLGRLVGEQSRCPRPTTFSRGHK